MAILHVLRHAGSHLSPRNVYWRAKKEFPKLTEPTVYRTLEFLAENGLARLSLAVGGHLTYEFASEDHHHIVCRVCGGEVRVQHHLLEDLYHKMESTSGYARIDSHVTFFGVCPKCRKT
jgi:Fe2+ or Zn2+ uptake regulation protein